MKNPFRFHRLVLLFVLILPVMIVAAGSSAAEDDEPTIAKDSIKVTAEIDSEGVRRGWKPKIEFRVNGPIASGSQLWVEFKLPGNKTIAKFDCQTGETEKGHWWSTWAVAGNSAIVPYTGLVDFAIHLRNELLGTEKTLYTGKAKVVKYFYPPNQTGAENTLYAVDDDWRIPIGYVFIGGSEGHGGRVLHVAFTYRGNPADVEAHLFYKGKDIAKFSKAGNGEGDWKPNDHQWGFTDCEFLGVYPTQKEADEGYDPKFGLDQNPGDYEVKVLIVNHLARSIKFTVDANGIVDNGIAKANKLGSDRSIVPVQVLGNQSQWDRLAWKTGAFYGNPLTGFTPAP